jgi:release factor glutamine methyltransferase
VIGRFDLIVSNPPYVTRGEMAGLAPELAFEPVGALDGGEDGLDAYRALVPQLRGLLVPGGVVLLEIGAAQAKAAAAILKGSGPCVSSVLTDLAGRDRCIEVRLP